MNIKKKIHIGIDEAGRGPLAGPVVACAFALDYSVYLSCLKKEGGENITLSLSKGDIRKFFDQLDDSKKLTEKKREELFHALVALCYSNKDSCLRGTEILRSAQNDDVNDSSLRGATATKQPCSAQQQEAFCYFGVGVVDNHIIDEINIREANKLAMQRALDELLLKIDQKDVHTVLVDGRDNYAFENLKKKPIYVIKGDQKILEIKAASIIAKTFRDKLMRSYSELYPHLHLDAHKGYGTKKHLESIPDKTKISGIHRQTYAPIKNIIEKKPRLLLHVCCGPDAAIPIVDLKEKYEVIAFWYDPNIQPKKEYNKRLKAFRKVCDIEEIACYEGEYDTDIFFEVIKGLEDTPEQGAKCIKCYEMRLIRSVKAAKDYSCTYFTTSLLMSPHKPEEKLFAQGRTLEKKYGIEFLNTPFRKNDGFNRSVEYTKKHKIFRQNYCGCIYSETFPGK
jgi:ribonuclease HII